MVLRKLALGLGLASVAYVSVLAWFRANENSLIFAPDSGPLTPPDPALQLDSRDVHLNSADGVSLVARQIPPPSTVDAIEATWVLYLHGSSGSIGLPEYNEAWAHFRQQGFGLFAVDYRGFGESGGELTEAGIYLDARAAYDYLVTQVGVSPKRICIYGFSMGAAVAIELASHVSAAALIVEGAWLSIPQLGEERYPFLPIERLAQNRFDSRARVAELTLPKLFVHARADSKIPVEHGRRLFELASAPKRFQELDGEHGTSHTVDRKFFQVVRTFVSEQGLRLAPLRQH